MVRDLIYYPSPILKKVSDLVPDDFPVLPELALDLRDTMAKHRGAGISAIQIGIPLKVLLAGTEIFVNAKILSFEGTKKNVTEGCLSVPGFFTKVPRYERVVVEYKTEMLESCTKTFDGKMAHILQHEIEHTDGGFFVDNLTKSVRGNLIGEMNKLRRQGKIK